MGQPGRDDRKAGRMSDYPEEVLTNLLDLQAELRGDEPPAHEPKDMGTDTGAEELDEVTVAVQDLSVSTAPPTQSVTERLATLNERLSRLEFELASVTKRISRIEPEPDAEPIETQADADDRWRSFLDLQKIVADRLDRN
jgi:hypothetical protein